MHYADAAETTREKTPEGMLRAEAVVTRAGVFPYDAGSLEAGPDGQTIMVERPVSVLKEPDTLASIRGAPVTLGHPPEGVSPENWNQYVVGNIVGEPRVDRSGSVVADILIGRADAIQLVEAGMSELSIGYEFTHKPAPDGSLATLTTIGPMQVNHVAVVERGRAGPGVRILDQEDSTVNENDAAKIQDAVTKGLEKALAGNASRAGDTAAISSAVMSAIQPVLDSIDMMKKKMEEEDMKHKKMQMEKDAKAAADELVKAATADGFARADAITKASAAGLVSPEIAAGLKDKSYKEIAATVLADRVPNAAAMDEQYLRGVMDTTLAGVTTAPTSGIPTGVGRATDEGDGPTIRGERSKAYDEFVKSFAEAATTTQTGNA